MTKYNNWNYEELGFRSELEMKESIARVERRMKMGDVERESERRREAQSTIDERGRIDFTALNEGARLERLDQVVQSRIAYDQEQAKLQAEQEEIQELMNAFSEHIQLENEAKAQKELQKEKEKLEADLQKEIYSKHNVKTDKEKERDEALSSLLDSLNV